MGDRFDLRAFHDEVLGHGSLPLATLRREIPGWVEAAVAAREGAPARWRPSRRHVRQPERVVLSGRFVRLEPIEERHRDDLLAAAAEDPATFRYMGTDLSAGADAWPAYLADALAARLRRLGDRRCGDRPGRRLIPLRRHRSRARTASRSAGPGSLRHTSAAPPTPRPSCSSLGTPSTSSGATRVALKTDGRNLRSQAAIERLGAQREGTLRRHMRMPDGFIRDTVYFSILAEEWPAVKARLEERLGAVRVSWPQALGWRMQRQLLDPVGTLSAVEVVRRLGGVQAQVRLGRRVVSSRPAPRISGPAR